MPRLPEDEPYPVHLYRVLRACGWRHAAAVAGVRRWLVSAARAHSRETGDSLGAQIAGFRMGPGERRCVDRERQSLERERERARR